MRVVLCRLPIVFVHVAVSFARAERCGADECHRTAAAAGRNLNDHAGLELGKLMLNIIERYITIIITHNYTSVF